LPAPIGLFNEENVPWLLDMLKNDVFRGQEKITKGQFMEVRGDSPDKNAFWRVVSQIAVEKFNMKEVFDMRSTVRLAAIEKLCKWPRSITVLYIPSSCFNSWLVAIAPPHPQALYPYPSQVFKQKKLVGLD
jgi:hypothetical protein